MPREDWDLTQEELIEQGYYGVLAHQQYREDLERNAREFEAYLTNADYSAHERGL